MSKGTTKAKIKKILKIKSVLYTLTTLVVIIGVYFSVKIIISRQQEGEVRTISISSLEKVVEISELPTIEYTYNAVAKVPDEKGNIKYYVAYMGKVMAGIDFSNLEFEVNSDAEEKQVVVRIPEVTIQNTDVDMGTMEYIFTKPAYETETVSQEAYKFCKDDLRDRITGENELFSLAYENAVTAVKGLYEPWISQLYPEYSIVVE